MLAATFAVLQFIGVCFISEPTEKPVGESNKTELLLEEEGISPKEAVKTWTFWQIWLTLLCVSMVNVYVSSFYKVFPFPKHYIIE